MASSSLPPSATSARPARPRRPWYLNVALAMAWVAGAIAILMSSMTLSILDYPTDELSLELEKKTDLTVDQRARQKQTFEAYTSALRAARKRVLPLAIGELLLGAAIVVFAQRATVGRSWARHALVQLTVVHVGLSVIEWVLTPDLRAPENNWELAMNNLDAHEVAEGASKLFRVGLGISVGAITVLGLSVPGSRTFYTAMDQLADT